MIITVQDWATIFPAPPSDLWTLSLPPLPFVCSLSTLRYPLVGRSQAFHGWVISPPLTLSSAIIMSLTNSKFICVSQPPKEPIDTQEGFLESAYSWLLIASHFALPMLKLLTVLPQHIHISCFVLSVGAIWWWSSQCFHNVFDLVHYWIQNRQVIYICLMSIWINRLMRDMLEFKLFILYHWWVSWPDS